MNFSLLFIQQAHEVVVLLNGLDGFDEDRLAARTTAMDHARNAALLLDLDRDHEALAADGDEFVLDGATFGEAPQVAAQRILNGAALLFDLTTNAGEFGRGAIFEGAIGLNLVLKIAA